jgi:hypothetical protein
MKREAVAVMETQPSSRITSIDCGSGYDESITPFVEAVNDYVQSYLTFDRRLGERATDTDAGAFA